MQLGSGLQPPLSDLHMDTSTCTYPIYTRRPPVGKVQDDAAATSVAVERALRMLDENDWAWDFMLNRNPVDELARLGDARIGDAGDAAVLTASVATTGTWSSSVQTEMLLIPLRAESRGFFTVGICVQREASRQMAGGAAHQISFQHVNGAHTLCHFIVDNRDGEVLMLGSLLDGGDDPVPDVVSFLQACASGNPGCGKTQTSRGGRSRLRCVWWSPQGTCGVTGSDQPRQQRLSAVLDRDMLLQRRFLDSISCCSFTESAVRTKCPECYLRLDVKAPCTCSQSFPVVPSAGFDFATDMGRLGGTYVGASLLTWRHSGGRLSTQNQCMSLSLTFKACESSLSDALRDIAPCESRRQEDPYAKQDSGFPWYSNLLEFETMSRDSQSEPFCSVEQYLGTGSDDMCLTLSDEPEVPSAEDLGSLLSHNSDVLIGSSPAHSWGCGEQYDALPFSELTTPEESPLPAPESTTDHSSGPLVEREAPSEHRGKSIDLPVKGGGVDEAKLARAELRKLKNRQAAARSNRRRKEKNDYLKAAIKDSRSRLGLLRARQVELRRENEKLREHLSRLT